MAINRYTGAGNLTRSAELRSLPSGTPLIEFGVAISERKKNQQTGEWEDDPVFLECVMYGVRAERICQYLEKGTKVSIDGRLRYSTWQDKETGQKRSKVDVVVNDIEFMSRREDNTAPSGPNYGPMPQPPQNVVQAPPQVQSMVNQAFENATPFNRSYPGQQQDQSDWESIPF